MSLGKLEDWVKAQVRHGDYATDSEVVREAVRRLKETHEAESPELQVLIDEGLESPAAAFTKADWEALRRLAREGNTKARAHR